MPHDVAYADFDEDGLVDVHSTEGVFKNAGGGALLAPAPMTFAETSVPLDLDGDARVDLQATLGAPFMVRVRESDGTFDPPITLAEEDAQVLATGDLDGDGLTDLLVTSRPFGFIAAPAVMLNQGGGHFAAAVRYPLPSSFRPVNDTGLSVVRLKDLDGDGSLDLAALNAAAGTVSVFLNRGQGALGPESVYPIEAAHVRDFSSGDLAAVDVDGDEACDLVVTYSPSGAGVLLHNGGGGRFDPPRQLLAAPIDSYSRSLWLQPVSAADLDGDGYPELVLGGDREIGPDVIGGQVTVLRNLAGKGFGPPEDYAIGPIPTSIVLADVNDDGKTDIIASTWLSDGMVSSPNVGMGLSVLFGYGDGTFLSSSDYALSGAYPSGRPAILDYRGDSRPEIIVVGGESFIVLSQTP